MIEVQAYCEDEHGGSDGAYSLLGHWTPESFCAELLHTLTGEWGLANSKGNVSLVITITPGSLANDPWIDVGGSG